MKLSWCYSPWLTLLGILSLGLVLHSRVQADTMVSILETGRTSMTTDAHRLVLFEPPTDQRVDSSRGGASRPTDVKCIHDQAYKIPLTPLIPQSGVGLTTTAHPTLLVYIPPTTATQAHLTLRDHEQRGLYQSRIQLAKTGGIVRITLSSNSPALTVGQTYHWSLALLCQPTQTDMPIAKGQIRRVERSVVGDGQPSLFAQAISYGQKGVWHDMLTTLATLRQTQPENRVLQTNWVEILQAEELGAIADPPLLN